MRTDNSWNSSGVTTNCKRFNVGTPTHRRNSDLIKFASEFQMGVSYYPVLPPSSNGCQHSGRIWKSFLIFFCSFCPISLRFESWILSRNQLTSLNFFIFLGRQNIRAICARKIFLLPYSFFFLCDFFWKIYNTKNVAWIDTDRRINKDKSTSRESVGLTE